MLKHDKLLISVIGFKVRLFYYTLIAKDTLILNMYSKIGFTWNGNTVIKVFRIDVAFSRVFCNLFSNRTFHFHNRHLYTIR